MKNTWLQLIYFILFLSYSLNAISNNPLNTNIYSETEKNYRKLYILPETAIIKSNQVNDVSHSSNDIKSLLRKAAYTGKRAIGMKHSLGTTQLNIAEINKKSISPILIFINRKSGSKVGKYLLRTLSKLLPEVQICDVTTSKPSEYLELFQECKRNLKVICCGGDGTVSWIIQEMTDLGMENVPVGIIPFGTGNDLCRALSEYTGSNSNLILPSISNPDSFFSQFDRAREVAIDLWKIHTEPLYPQSNFFHNKFDKSKEKFKDFASSKTRSLNANRLTKPKSKNIKKDKPIKNVNNYFGIGVDGHISLIFDNMRKMYPHLFFSEIINKFLYMLVGIYYILRQESSELSSCVELICDGKVVPIPKGTRGIVFLNINSYAGGSKLWKFSGMSKTDSGRWKPTQFNDRILEVVAVSGIGHLGQIKAGISLPVPIAQGSSFEIRCFKKLPMQIDGEPWIQKPCRMVVSCENRVTYLIPRNIEKN